MSLKLSFESITNTLSATDFKASNTFPLVFCAFIFTSVFILESIDHLPKSSVL